MLKLNNVSAGYGKNIVLNNVTASFKKGELNTVIGVNGCGKSTLLKATLGILPLSRGEILIDGVAINTIKRKDIAKKISYLAQNSTIPDMTVKQMVLCGRFPHLSYPRNYSKADYEIANNAMETAGISHLASKPLSVLSGGMRQSAFIAMALAQDTDYILLDEPTAYLDIAHQLKLMKLLKKLKESGKGIIAVMHDLPLAFDFSDTVTAIDKGTVVAFKTPKEICSTPIIEEIFGVKIKSTDNKFHYDY